MKDVSNSINLNKAKETKKSGIKDHSNGMME